MVVAHFSEQAKKKATDSVAFEKSWQQLKSLLLLLFWCPGEDSNLHGVTR